MAVVVTSDAPRRAYRRREVCELYGVSLYMIDQMTRRGRIRSRRIGERVVLLNAKDVEREFGLGEPEIRAETIAELRDLLA